MNQSLYVQQLSRVKVLLQPSQLLPNFEKYIEQSIKQEYGNKTHLTGYVIKNSIEIVKIEPGSNHGANLNGDLTFWVTFKALYLQPIPGIQVKVRVDSVSKIGAEAIYYPMSVIVPRLQETPETKDTYDQINRQLSELHPGDYIRVKIIDFAIRQGKMVAVAHFISKEQADSKQSLTLHSEQLLQADQSWTPMFQIDHQPPSVVEDLGDNQALVVIKEQITPYAGRDPSTGQFRIWDSLIKYVINPYELVDIYRPPERIRYQRSIVKYLTDKQIKQGIIWTPKALYPVFSRAYFKIFEMIQDFHLLSSWVNKPITVACLAEGPGGFIQAILDFRHYQHGHLWTKDSIHAITLKKSSPGSPIQDWTHPRASKYFERVKEKGISLNLSYGKDTGDLLDVEQIQAFVQQVQKTPLDKAQLVTADGGIELKSDQEYSLQELFNAKLFYAEMLTALSILDRGGHFVIKIYDIFYQITTDILLLMSYYFDSITIHKPLTSRSANSEKYIVCQGFNGISQQHLNQLYTIFDKWLDTEPYIRYLDNSQFVQQWIFIVEAPESPFKSNIATYNNYFMSHQINKINEGITLIKNPQSRTEKKLAQYHRLQIQRAIDWCQTYGIPHISNSK